MKAIGDEVMKEEEDRKSIVVPGHYNKAMRMSETFSQVGVDSHFWCVHEHQQHKEYELPS